VASSGVTHGVMSIQQIASSCMQAVELCRLLAELEGVEDAVPSARLQSAASSPSIQVHRPRYRCMGDGWTDRVVGLVGEDLGEAVAGLRCSREVPSQLRW
jgi:hypothetical protein